MLHRHLDHQRFTLAAIDDVISRGRWREWAELRRAALSDRTLLHKVDGFCPLRATPSLLDALCRRTPHRCLTGSSSCPVPHVSSASCRMPCWSEEPPRRSTPSIASHATPTMCLLICSIASIKFQKPCGLAQSLSEKWNDTPLVTRRITRLVTRTNRHACQYARTQPKHALRCHRACRPAKNHRRYGTPGVPPSHRPKGDRAIEAREGHRWRSAAASPP